MTPRARHRVHSRSRVPVRGTLLNASTQFIVLSVNVVGHSIGAEKEDEATRRGE
jgi:hypothetical protein